jgi:hypothetical protein
MLHSAVSSCNSYQQLLQVAMGSCLTAPAARHRSATTSMACIQREQLGRGCSSTECCVTLLRTAVHCHTPLRLQYTHETRMILSLVARSKPPHAHRVQQTPIKRIYHGKCCNTTLAASSSTHLKAVSAPVTNPCCAHARTQTHSHSL